MSSDDGLLVLTQKASTEYSFVLRLRGLVEDISFLFLNHQLVYTPLADYHAPIHWPMQADALDGRIRKVYTEGADRIDIAAAYYSSSSHNLLEKSRLPIARSHVYVLVTPVNDEPHFSNITIESISMRRLRKSMSSPYSSEKSISTYICVDDADEDSGDVINATISVFLNCSNSCGGKCAVRFDSSRSFAGKIEVIDNNSENVRMIGYPSQVNKALQQTFLTSHGFIPCPVTLNASIPSAHRILYLSFDDEDGNRSHVERVKTQYSEAYVVSFAKLQPLSSPIISAATNVSALLPPLRIITTSKAIPVNESLNVILEISARMGEVSFRSESIPGVEFTTRYAQTFQGSDSECAQRVQISTRRTHNSVYSSSMTLSGNLSPDQATSGLTDSI